MKYILGIGFVVLVCIFLSCESQIDNSKNDIEASSLDISRTGYSDSLKELVFLSGDIHAYEALILHYVNTSDHEGFYEHIHMASKYSYYEAYVNLYTFTIEDFMKQGVSECDISADLMLFLITGLEKARENGNENAQTLLEDIPPCWRGDGPN